MALIQCTECQSEVSSSALTCPKCGFQLKKPKRGFFGFLFKWSFILFNLFMCYAVFAGMDGATDRMNEMSGAERTGATIGTGLGLFMLLGIWAMGDLILGLFVLFTRPKA